MVTENALNKCLCLSVCVCVCMQILVVLIGFYYKILNAVERKHSTQFLKI